MHTQEEYNPKDITPEEGFHIVPNKAYCADYLEAQRVYRNFLKQHEKGHLNALTVELKEYYDIRGCLDCQGLDPMCQYRAQDNDAVTDTIDDTVDE